MKKFIICCDGTWDKPTNKAVTNVVKLTRALKPEADGIPQVVFNNWGVGTGDFDDTSLSRIVKNVAQALAIDEKRADVKPVLWTRTPKTGLSDIALNWMIEKATIAGLSFNPHYLSQITNSDPLAKLHCSRRGIYWMKKTYLRSVASFNNTFETVYP